MAENLLNSLKSYITPEVISQASNLLGESENGVTKAVESIIPTVLGGLLNKSDNSSTMSSVMNLVTQSSSNSGGILSNLTGLLSGSSSDSGLGSNLLSLLFGGKLAGIKDLISDSSGIKSSSVGSLFGMITPMILSHFSKSGTSMSGLNTLLSANKSSILSALPVGLSSLAGFTNIFGGNNTTKGSSRSGLPKWLLPLLLIAAVLAGLYFFTRGCKKADATLEDGTTKVDSLAKDASAELDTLATDAKETAESVTLSLGEFFRFKLPNNVELNIPKNGIENQIVTWMSDKTKVVDKTTWFNFDRLLFETGKSTLKPESQEQLKNIAEIMKAFPQMEIKLGGYTDNVGEPASNLKLSDSRAKTVMGELVKLGIAQKRLSAEGYGEQHPVASNDTEEGRTQNRRIAIRITKK